MAEEEKCCCDENCECSCDEGCGCSEEVEEIGFDLSESEIDEWISELSRLKEEKGNVILCIDEDLVLNVNYSDVVEESEEETEEEKE